MDTRVAKVRERDEVPAGLRSSHYQLQLAAASVRAINAVLPVGRIDSGTGASR